MMIAGDSNALTLANRRPAHRSLPHHRRRLARRPWPQKCGSVQTLRRRPALIAAQNFQGWSKHMYIGGILGTLLVICLIVWLVRRV